MGFRACFLKEGTIKWALPYFMGSNSIPWMNFFETCKKADTDHMLVSLAGNFYNFMETLNALHLPVSAILAKKWHILRAFRLLQKVTGEVMVEQES